MTRRRKIVAAAVAGAVVAAGIAIPLAVIPSAKPKVTVKAPQIVFTPPKTINTTCSKDDTNSLGTWLLSVPNGTPGHDHVAKLKKGACYEIDGSWWWRAPEYIVLNGNGATIKQGAISPTAKWVTVGGHNNPAVNPYCGSKLGIPYMDDAYSGLTSQPLLISLEGGCNMTIENLTILGRHPQGGDPAPGSFYQPASFISLYGAQKVLIDHVTERGPYGDFVTCDGFHEAPGGGGSMPSTDVTVENSSFTDAGRTGISETNGCHRILVTHDTLSCAALTMFDIEQDVTYPAYAEEDIDITKNTLVGYADGSCYSFLVAADTGSELQRVAFTDNTLTKGAQMRVWLDPHAFGGSINNSVLVAGNVATVSSTWPNRSPVNVLNMVDVLVMGNTDLKPTYGGAGRPFANVGKNKTNLACGDVLPNGKPLDATCPSPLPVVTPPMVAALPS